jgi:hypothetical protein
MSNPFLHSRVHTIIVLAAQQQQGGQTPVIAGVHYWTLVDEYLVQFRRMIAADLTGG